MSDIEVSCVSVDLEPMPESRVRVRSPSPVDQSALREKIAGKARADDWVQRMRAELSRLQSPYTNYREFAVRFGFDPYSSVVYDPWIYDQMPES